MSRIFGSLFALLFALDAHAVTLLSANLTHSQETTQGVLLTSTGDPRPLSFGSGTFIINDAMTSMSFVVDIFNIDVTGSQTADTFDNLVAAHIHGPAAPGSNGPVRWGFFGAPDNDVAPSDLVVTPFAGVGGRFTSTWDATEGNAGTNFAVQLPNILAGLTYINFHTVQFGGGEIRGQLLLVPEPAVLLLVAIALLAVVIQHRRGRS